MGKNKVQTTNDETNKVLEELSSLYLKIILPVEQAFDFHSLGHGKLSEGDFNSPPMVLLIGPYSAGKTSFIEYLIGREFPGERVGPEPTTDTFTAVFHGEDDRLIPGNALTVDPSSKFYGLQTYGNNFLTRFNGSQVSNCEALRNLIVIDSPGVLSGEKQTLGRSYDYASVVEWFAERSDMIILLFDVYKCDLSDEMNTSIKALGKYADKVKVVLNKSDSISHQHLMNVYGALLWNLGRVIKTPEVVKVYIGSFWDEHPKNEETAALIKKEMNDFMRDLNDLPRLGAVRRLNDMVTRLRLIIVHAIICDHLRNETPRFRKRAKKQSMIDNIPATFESIMKRHELSSGDFPDVQLFKKFIGAIDISKLPKLLGTRMNKGKRMDELKHALKVDIPSMLSRLPGINKCHDKKHGIDSQSVNCV